MRAVGVLGDLSRRQLYGGSLRQIRGGSQFRRFNFCRRDASVPSNHREFRDRSKEGHPGRGSEPAGTLVVSMVVNLPNDGFRAGLHNHECNLLLLGRGWSSCPKRSAGTDREILGALTDQGRLCPSLAHTSGACATSPEDMAAVLDRSLGACR